jgi:murein DD-endopeptidase
VAKVTSRITVVVAMLASGSMAVGETRTPIAESVDLRVHHAPRLAPIGGDVIAAYELHLTNYLGSATCVHRIEVSDDASILSRLEGETLRGVLDPVLEPGTNAVVYFWLATDGATPVRRLHHKVTSTAGCRTGTPQPRAEGHLVLEIPRSAPVALGPPLRGGPWAGIYDPGLERGHRRTFYTVDGRVRVPGRHAVDWFRVGADGSLVASGGDSFADWHGFDAEVLAVADAVVIEALDDLPDILAPRDTAVRQPLAEHSGNHIVLRLADGSYAVYEHLRAGSIKVRTGDDVRKGDVIARVGNSGSTFGPHLHFHVADSSRFLAGEGLPFVVERHELIGRYASVRDFAEARPWTPEPSPLPLDGSMHPPNSVVMFP